MDEATMSKFYAPESQWASAGCIFREVGYPAQQRLTAGQQLQQKARPAALLRLATHLTQTLAPSPSPGSPDSLEGSPWLVQISKTFAGSSLRASLRLPAV